VVGVIFVNSKDELTVPADPDKVCAAVGNLPILLVSSSVGALLRDGVALSQSPEAAEVSWFHRMIMAANGIEAWLVEVIFS
jgi:hypothetical protein